MVRIALLSLSLSLSCTSVRSDRSASNGEPAKVDERDAPAEPEPVAVAKVDPPAPPRDVPPTADEPGTQPAAFHATEHQGVLEVEILGEALSEKEGDALAKLLESRESGDRVKLDAPGSKTLAKALRVEQVTLVTTKGIETAKVVEVWAHMGPSALHGFLVLDRPARRGEHALALMATPKNAGAKLRTIATRKLDAADEVRKAVIAAAKRDVTEASGRAKWAKAQVVELDGVKTPFRGTLFLFDLELEEGGAHAIYGSTKDGGVEPLVELQEEGRLTMIGACDLDGDGTDELVGELDAFEGSFVNLYRWDTGAGRYVGESIAGDGT